MEKCNINISSKLSTHPYFSELTYRFDTANTSYESINRLCKLYIERSFSVWKEPSIVFWLEKNIDAVMNGMAKSEKMRIKVKECEDVRTQSFLNTPDNIFRHIVVSGK